MVGLNDEATGAEEEPKRGLGRLKRVFARLGGAFRFKKLGGAIKTWLTGLKASLRPQGSFRAMLVVVRLELATTLASAVTHGIIGLFLLGCGLYLFVAYDFFGVNEATVRPLVTWMPWLLAILLPGFTAAAVASELKRGTIQLLESQPVTDAQIVIAKYTGCLLVLSLLTVLSATYPLLVSFLGPLDPGPVAGSAIGTFFLGAAFMAIGLMVSTFTTSWIKALLLTWLLNAFLVGANDLLGLLVPAATDLLASVSFKSHYVSLERGIIDIRDVIFFLTLTWLALTVAIQSLRIRLRGFSLGSGLALFLAAGLAFGANFFARS